jgi:hypothetical protein
MFRFNTTAGENPSGLPLDSTVCAAGVCRTGWHYLVVHKERSKEGGFSQSEPHQIPSTAEHSAISNLDGLGECAAWIVVSTCTFDIISLTFL